MSNLATITNNILADSGIDDINVVVTNGSYANPAWITSLAWSKITGAPANIVTGTGNNNYIAKFTSTGSTIGNSLLQSTSANVFINQENTSFGVDAQSAIRLGFTKKSGFNPYLSYAVDPFVIASSSGPDIFSSNTFTPRLTLDLSGNATLSGRLRVDGTTDPNATNAAYFWNASGIGPTISGLSFQVRVGAPQITRFFISDLGHVGVNTVTPQSNFVVSNDAGTQSIELNQLTARARIFSIDRSTSAWLPLYINDSGGNVIIGSTSNNGSLFQANGEASFGAATEKLSMSSQSLGFNRRVSNGVIYDSNAFAYQFQHTQSTTAANDYLALQVYNTAGGAITGTALTINGAANVLINTGTDNGMGAKLQVNGSGTFIGLLYVDKGGADQPNVRLRTSTDAYQTQWGIGQLPNSLNFGLAYFNGSSWSSPYITVSTAAAVTLSNLAGTGSRIVVADASGTLSASSALSGYVPYTGANQNVNLGANTLQVNQRVGTIDDFGFHLRGVSDITHKIYYRSSDLYNAWEYNTGIRFYHYNAGNPALTHTFLPNGNIVAEGSITASGARPQFIADGGASAGAEILLKTSLATVPTLRRNWSLNTEDQVEGDFAIKCSTTAGGTPNTTRLSILRDGMMGVNMTTPIYQLDITTANYRSFRIQSSDDALITMGSTIASSQFYSIGVSSSVSGQGANLFWIGTSTNNPSGTLTKNFTLSATGAATFSSSVTATGNASTTPSFVANNPSGSSGTAQHYIDFTAGATTLGRILRGNGAAGLEANGLNIDNYTGFKVRLNQLGGTGGSFTIDGGNLGLGVTPSAWNLGGSPVFQLGNSGVHLFGAGTQAQFGSNAYYDGTNYKRVVTGNATRYLQNSTGGEHLWETSNSQVAGNNITFVSVMNLDASGYLFVGGLRIKGSDTSNSIYAGSSSMAITAEAGYNISIGRVSDVTRALNVNTTNGNVGINTTNPTGAAGRALVLNSGSEQGRICIKTSSTGDNAGSGLQILMDGLSASIEQRENASLGFSTNAQTRMFILAGGNVGINNLNAQDRLDVIGEVLFGAQTERLSAGSASLAWNRRVATGQIYDSGRFAYQFQHTGSTTASNDYLALQVYNNSGGGVNPTAFVVNGNANTLLGTGVDNSHRLRVEGSVYASGYMYTASEGTGFAVDANPNAGLARVGLMKYGGFEGMLISGSSTVVRLGHRTDSDYVLAGGTPSIRVDLVINTAGAATFISSVTATSFFESSDSRIKTELEDVLDYAAIANVKAKYYEKNGKAELGYYAQDFEALMPSAISENEEGYLNLSYREVHTAKIAYLEKRINELEQQLKNK